MTAETEQKIAAIYARVSTDEQADNNNSLPAQVRKCRQYADLHGFVVPDDLIFREDYTGTKFNRPEIDKLLQLAKRGEVDVIVVLASDRLTREPSHGEEYRKLLRKYGVELHYTTRGKIEHTPEAEMFSGIEGQFDKYWRHKLLDAMMTGRWEKAQGGKWVGNGRAPYGYDKDGAGKDAALVINSGRAKIILLIFEWYVKEYLSVSEIARRLTEMNEPTPGDIDGVITRKKPKKTRGYAQWAPSNIYHILRNEVYAGVSNVHTKTNVDGKIVKRARSEWIGTAVPAIVPRELWEVAQQKIGTGSKTASRNAKRDRLLSRVIACQCGYAIHSSHKKNKIGKEYIYYSCSGRSNAKGSCGMPVFSAEQVDEEAWKCIVEILTDETKLAVAQQEQAEEVAKDNAKLQERLDTLDDSIARYERQLEGARRQIAKAQAEDDKQEEAYWEKERRDTKEKLNVAKTERDQLVIEMTSGVMTKEDAQELMDIGREYGDDLRRPDLPLEFRRGVVTRMRLTASLAVEDAEKVLYLYYCKRKERRLLGCVNSVELSSNSTTQSTHVIVFRIPLRKAA